VDVGVTITPPQLGLRSGQQAVFTATIEDHGPGVATRVVARLRFARGLRNPACVLVSSPALSNAARRCSGDPTVRIGTLAAGQRVVYRITATAVGTPGQRLRLSGAVTASEHDANASNNDASAIAQIILPQVKVTARAVDVGVTIAPALRVLRSGQQAVFNATIEDHGPGAATDVVARFRFARGLHDPVCVRVSAPARSTAARRCSGDPTVRIGALTAGRPVMYRITATAVGSGGQRLALTGTVTHSGADANAADNHAQALVRIMAPPPPPPPPPAPPPRVTG